MSFHERRTLCNDMPQQPGGMGCSVTPLSIHPCKLAQHPCSDLQRHAARAYWHLVATPASRKHFLAADGVGALLHLARMATKSVQGKSLAQQALKRLADDPQVGRGRRGAIKHSKSATLQVSGRLHVAGLL